MKLLFHTTIACVLVSVCVGCKTKIVHVPVETIKYEDRVKVEKDTHYIRDSIYMYVKGDSVFKYVDRIVYRDIYKVDTIRVEIKKDVPYPVEVEKIVTVNKVKWYQRLLMYLGCIFVVIFGFKVAVKRFKRW